MIITIIIVVVIIITITLITVIVVVMLHGLGVSAERSTVSITGKQAITTHKQT